MPPTDRLAHPTRPGPRGVRLRPLDDARRHRPKPLGVPSTSRAGPGARLVGLSVADARHHAHVIGVTGVGKSTWLAHHVISEAQAGRGVALIDPQGDLARQVIERLPADTADRLILLEPGDPAPPAWNPLHPTPPHLGRPQPGSAQSGAGAGAGAEWAAEGVVNVFRRLHGGWWGPRMDDLMRAACLTLARRPGSTIADVVALLTDPSFRRQVIARHGEPPGLVGYWAGLDQLTPAGLGQLTGPVLARVRALLARRFARDLLTVPVSTIDLSAVLDGAILIARLPKGELGEDVSRLVGALLLSGLWAAITRRAVRPPDQRPDATIVVDEAHNVVHLPIAVDDALAESRGYRVSCVLAHQHFGQLPIDVGHALDANARNKVIFTVTPADARHLARHVAPTFDDYDLTRREAFHATIRAVHDGRDTRPFTIATLPLPAPVPGRADRLRAAARANAGLTDQQRRAHQPGHRVATGPPLARHLGAADQWPPTRRSNRSSDPWETPWPEHDS